MRPEEEFSVPDKNKVQNDKSFPPSPQTGPFCLQWESSPRCSVHVGFFWTTL